MKLNLVVLFAGVILLGAAIPFDVNYFNYSKPVPYAQWQTITLNDFKGLKKPAMTMAGFSEFAFIKTSREIFFHENSIEVITYFHPSRSYVFNKDIRSPDLLRHEIYHFHIAEYCSRLLRKEIFDSKNIFSRSLITDFENKYIELENELQRKYDEDSEHGYIMMQQKVWEIKMDGLLSSLEQFAEPAIAINKL